MVEGRREGTDWVSWTYYGVLSRPSSQHPGSQGVDQVDFRGHYFVRVLSCRLFLPPFFFVVSLLVVNSISVPPCLFSSMWDGRSLVYFLLFLRALTLFVWFHLNLRSIPDFGIGSTGHRSCRRRLVSKDTCVVLDLFPHFPSSQS